MKLLRAGGMLPSGTVTPETPVSPLSPLHRSRLWGALKALPIVRRFYSPNVGGSAPALRSAPTPTRPEAAPAADAAAAAPAEVATPGRVTAAAAAPPPPASSSASSSAQQVSIGAVLRTGVVMEEGGVGDGFTTPVAGASYVQSRSRRGLGFPTPARGDGYAPDSEHSSETINGRSGAPVVGENGFTTPAQGGGV